MLSRKVINLNVVITKASFFNQNELKALDLLKILTDIYNGKSIYISSRMYQFLLSQEFIREETPINDLKNKQQLAAQYDDAKKKLKETNSALEKCNQNKNSLSNDISIAKKTHNKFFHKLFAGEEVLGTELSKISKQEEQLKELETESVSLQQEVQKLESFIEENAEEVQYFEFRRDELDLYSKYKDKYIAIEDLGLSVLTNLHIRSSRLKGVKFNKIQAELEIMEKSIEKKLSRFYDFYTKLVEFGLKRNAKAIQFAIALSTQKGSFDEIYKRAQVASSILYENNWKGYDRLGVIAMLSAQKGDMKKLCTNLLKTYASLISQGFSQDYATLREAAVIMQIPGSIPNKIKRFNKMRTALSTRQWKGGSHAVCMIAANLAKRRGFPNTIADQFRKQELSIVKSGAQDRLESGIAAITLMDAKGSKTKKASQFRKALETMVEYGWANNPSNYGAAATISLLPGTIEENVSLLDFITEDLKLKGTKSNVTSLGLSILTGSYYQVLSNPSNHINRLIINDDGINIGKIFTGAVIGDIFDDGGLNLSEGAIIGGLIGGPAGGMVGGVLSDLFFGE